MSLTVCLAANTLGYPEGGGHAWAYLNWALGFRALGCRVIWLEEYAADESPESTARRLSQLRERLIPYDFGCDLAVTTHDEQPLPADIANRYMDVDSASDADLLVNIGYWPRRSVVGRFRRSALIDIDPGLLQVWMSKGWMNLPAHDVYFTTGETVGTPGALIPDAGLHWEYTPPCVALNCWPACRPSLGGPFTTVSHWSAEEAMEDQDGPYWNDKRTGFLPFLDLPKLTSQPLELALRMSEEEEGERTDLQNRGWSIVDSRSVASSPERYRRYIQGSRGEFACVKPSCVRLQNAWVSDRSLCYLASAKPVVVQHTGPSRFLPEDAGMIRFRTLMEAALSLERVASDYERHCRLARALAEDHFDAVKAARGVLERTLA